MAPIAARIRKAIFGDGQRDAGQRATSVISLPPIANLRDGDFLRVQSPSGAIRTIEFSTDGFANVPVELPCSSTH